MFRSALIAPMFLTASAGASLAHGAGSGDPDHLWSQWSFDPLVTVPLLTATVLYVRGYGALHRRLGHGPAAIPVLRLGAVLSGFMAIILALLSPLDHASGALLSAHMIQHVLLVAVAPPLLLAGRPEAICTRGLPGSWRRSLARSRPIRAALRTLQAAARPLPASILHGIALWIWHVPALFEAAQRNAALHALEHACFFGTALLFWRAIVSAARRPENALAGAAAALLTLVHGGFLSALISLSPTLLYPVSTQGAASWGLSPLDDQQLAGAIMWVPAGAIYLIAGLALAARAIAPQPSREPAALGPVGEAKRSPAVP